MTFTTAGAIVPVVTAVNVVDAGLLDRLTALRQTLAPGLTDGELELFALVAQRKGLDPFSSQIMAVKRNTRQGPRVTYQTGIDGYRSIAERTGQYRGSDLPVFGPACECGAAPKGHPEYADVTVHRRLGPDDYIHQPARARWHEFIPGEEFMWRDKPEVMLGKCAEAQALRKAFPWVLGDIYIPEELARPDEDSGPAPTVTARARVAAKAAELRSAQDDPGAAPAEEPEREPSKDSAPEAIADPGGSPEPTDEIPPVRPASRGPLTAQEFAQLVKTAEINPGTVRKTAVELFPGRPSTSLTPDEWGQLWAVVEDRGRP